MNKPGKLLGIISALFLMSCATQEPFYNESVSNWQDYAPGNSSELIYEVYLIGDSRRAY